MSILGALGLNELIKFVKEKPKIKIGSINYFSKFLISVYGIICIVILVRIFIYCMNSSVFLSFNPHIDEYFMRTNFAQLTLAFSINVLFSIILLIITLLVVSLFKSRKAYILIILLLFGQLFFAGFFFNETCKPQLVYPKTELTDKLIELDGTVAVINDKWSMTNNPQALLPPNMLMYYGIKEVGGYDSLMLESYKKELENLAGENLSPVENGNMIMIKKPFKGLEKYADYMVSLNEYEDYEKIGVFNNVFIYKL